VRGYNGAGNYGVVCYNLGMLYAHAILLCLSLKLVLDKIREHEYTVSVGLIKGGEQHNEDA